MFVGLSGVPSSLISKSNKKDTQCSRRYELQSRSLLPPLLIRAQEILMKKEQEQPLEAAKWRTIKIPQRFRQ